MKIQVEFFGFPAILDVVGREKLELEFSGETVKDVIEELIKRYGKTVRAAFYDAQGNFDLMIQIALNGNFFIAVDKHDTSLNEGDTVMFMLLLAGG